MSSRAWLVAWSSAVLPLLAFAADPCAEVKQEGPTGNVDVVALVRGCTDITVTVRGQDLVNVRATPPVPVTFELRNQPRTVLVSFRPVDRRQAHSFSWTDKWQHGRRLAGSPAPYVYALPFRGTFPLVQGPFGSFSHQRGTRDEQAYDWMLPEGTQVYAARPGEVVATRRDVSVGGADESFREEVNYVVVRHQDGTYAEYLHLERGGVEVSVGDAVTTDTVLGRSGNTGYSRGPHLHFAVFNPIDGNDRTTWPLSFAVKPGPAEVPSEDDAPASPPPPPVRATEEPARKAPPPRAPERNPADEVKKLEKVFEGI